MLNARFKFLLVFILFLGVFLLNTQYTDADIFAERDVRNNTFKAASINFFARSSINNMGIINIFNTIGLIPEGYDFGAVKLKRDGNITFKYRLSSKITNGDETFCNNLNLKVLKRNLAEIYSGKMTDVSLQAEITNDGISDWIFLLSLDQTGDNLKNKICEFNLVFKTYRNSPAENGGLYARRVLTNVVSSGTW